MITINNLNISFEEEVVHKNFSLIVKKGQKLAITGESGRGKSTLLNALAGFIPHYEGQISVDGITLSANTVEEIRAKMAWLPQNTSLHLGSEISDNAIDYYFCIGYNDGGAHYFVF